MFVRSRGAWSRLGDGRFTSALIFNRHTFDLATLEQLARRFGRRSVEADEAGAVIGSLAFLHPFGERVRGRKYPGDFQLRRVEVLLGLVFSFISADLDKPAAARMQGS